ncbi:methylated-DNA--[protein]-cysteine S-methyltransferase [Marinihelvus fidelis]|uniref:Methylated-DNA--protein-cysteine methyltransferase n=2 Tax=Marinihelvus fidelis TaxID=2613842 RepID=A0A5N0T5J9_9GAMM|nr:methylated-DNA--[protein]-cysteine S-methyltransferase [Marinihelvus fidelis]KAA9130213.1 methylated-DNA--[protein]-cysteine S-methyltransferase [Marinihelvus fidelis]
MNSPIGPLQLVADNGHLVEIRFPGQHLEAAPGQPGDPALAAARSQLEEYFAGQRRQFDLPLAASGTAFQQQVWRALAAIPYGQLRSYRDIALSIGRARAVRAVGAANGRNPLPIVVPCHRVVGADGSLTGFAGGLETKRQLLELEGAI